MRARTRLATVAACCAMALALGACSSDGDSGDDTTASPSVPTTTSATATPSDTTATSTPTATTSSGSPSPTGDAAVARCRTSDVRVTVRDLDSGAGRRYAEVVLTNATGSQCRVEGYGGLQLLDASRNPVPSRLVRLTRPAARPVVLDPGGSATSQISFSVVPTDGDARRGPCQPEPAFALVTPPDQKKSTRITWNLGPVCDQGRIEQRSYQPAGD
jgi:hypothetical protein